MSGAVRGSKCSRSNAAGLLPLVCLHAASPLTTPTEMLTSKPKNGFSSCSVQPIETNISPTLALRYHSRYGRCFDVRSRTTFVRRSCSLKVWSATLLFKIFERLTELRLDDEASLVKFGGWVFRGPLAVPVTCQSTDCTTPSAAGSAPPSMPSDPTHW